MSLRHAVVGVDFTPGWERMRDRLEVLQVLGIERVTLLYVLGGRYPASPELGHRDHYQRRLDEEASHLEVSGTEVDTELRVGDSPRELAVAATELGAGVVVLGSTGHTPLRDMALGSTVTDVIHEGHLPTLLIPLGGDLHPGGGGVVLGTDGSEASRRAEALMGEFDTKLPRAVVTVVGDDERDTDTEGQGLLVRRGRPAEEIARVAEERSADLVVVGRRGRNPIVDLVIGSTAERLVVTACRPVLIVP